MRRSLVEQPLSTFLFLFFVFSFLFFFFFFCLRFFIYLFFFFFFLVVFFFFFFLFSFFFFRFFFFFFFFVFFSFFFVFFFFFCFFFICTNYVGRSHPRPLFNTVFPSLFYVPHQRFHGFQCGSRWSRRSCRRWRRLENILVPVISHELVDEIQPNPPGYIIGQARELIRFW